MPSPIEMMIDRAGLKCTRCKTPQSVGCKCWEPFTLRCPECGKEQKTAREKSDPLTSVVLVFPCPQCGTPEATPAWLDKDGKEVVE